MKSISIIGAGTMGAGIAQVSALAGHTVTVFDVSKQISATAIENISASLQQGLAKRIFDSTQVSEALSKISIAESFDTCAHADIIIEAVVENLKIKQELFTRLEAICSPQTIFASNTSSLSITSIASQTTLPERVIGLHFFNPVPRMKLVEIIMGYKTSEKVVETIVQFVQSLKKTGILVKDTPGFIVNRVARPFYGEALKILGEGIAPVEEIDKILKLEAGFKMGPFELMDLIGIDVNFSVTQSIYHQTFEEPRYKPHILQQRMVESGLLGKKTKRGFYKYE